MGSEKSVLRKKSLIVGFFIKQPKKNETIVESSKFFSRFKSNLSRSYMEVFEVTDTFYNI